MEPTPGLTLHGNRQGFRVEHKLASKTMHILFLTDNFPPEVNAPAARTFEHCREWIKTGSRVTVLTGAPNFPAGRVFAGYKNRLIQAEDLAGIRVIRVWTYITANEGFLLRILDYLSFMASATIAACFLRDVDVVIGTSPQFFTACAARLVAATKRVPFIFEVRDLWPESIRAVGAMKNEAALRLLERLELRLYNRADGIVSVTRSFRKNLVKRGVDPAKIAVVTNGADLTRFQPQPKDAVLLQELGLKDKFVVGYIGTHGAAHALETLLDAATILSSDPVGEHIRFVFLGDGARRRHLKTYSESKKLGNVIFVESVARDKVVKFWSILDASIIHLRKTALFETVIPSKIFEAMAMGIPIVLGVAGESAELVETEGVGITVQPENSDQMSKAILRLAQDESLRNQIRARGPVAAVRFDRRTLASEMLRVIKSTIEHTARPGQ